MWRRLGTLIVDDVTHVYQYTHRDYTLSHPENDRDVTEPKDTRCWQDASLYASILVFLFEGVRKHKLRAR